MGASLVPAYAEITVPSLLNFQKSVSKMRVTPDACGKAANCLKRRGKHRIFWPLGGDLRRTFRGLSPGGNPRRAVMPPGGAAVAGIRFAAPGAFDAPCREVLPRRAVVVPAGCNRISKGRVW